MDDADRPPTWITVAVGPVPAIGKSPRAVFIVKPTEDPPMLGGEPIAATLVQHCYDDDEQPCSRVVSAFYIPEFGELRAIDPRDPALVGIYPADQEPDEGDILDAAATYADAAEWARRELELDPPDSRPPEGEMR